MFLRFIIKVLNILYVRLCYLLKNVLGIKIRSLIIIIVPLGAEPGLDSIVLPGKTAKTNNFCEIDHKSLYFF